MKVNQLTNRQLNHAVFVALGFTYRDDFKYGPMYMTPRDNGETSWESYPPNYCTDWAQGGPIIEREKISFWDDGIFHEPEFIWFAGFKPEGFTASDDEDLVGIDALFEQQSSTPLIAAMRCFVASKLGEDIDLPKELL